MILSLLAIYAITPKIEYSAGDPLYAKEHYAKLDLHNLHEEAALLNVGIHSKLVSTVRSYATVLRVYVNCSKPTGEWIETKLIPEQNSTLYSSNTSLRSWAFDKNRWYTYSIMTNKEIASVSMRVKSQESVSDWPVSVISDTSCMVDTDSLHVLLTITKNSPYDRWDDGSVPVTLQKITVNSIRKLSQFLTVESQTARTYLKGIMDTEPTFKIQS